MAIKGGFMPLFFAKSANNGRFLRVLFKSIRPLAVHIRPPGAFLIFDRQLDYWTGERMARGVTHRSG
jgi:hypothetical protein